MSDKLAWTVVQHTRDHRGMWSSICPQCRTLFVYWDDDDLDEDGDLLCYCADEPTRAARS